jgi:hypothetical protein
MDSRVTPQRARRKGSVDIVIMPPDETHREENLTTRLWDRDPVGILQTVEFVT